MRIGLASIDGAYIDQHFGSARYWQIYDVDSEGRFVETRKTSPTCNGHCEGGFQAQLEVLADCDALFVAKIGESAACLQTIVHSADYNGKHVFSWLTNDLKYRN